MAPAFNSYFGNSTVASNTTLALSGVTLTVGNLAVIGVTAQANVTVSTFSDSLGNTWTPITPPAFNSTAGKTIFVYYSLITTGGSSTITVVLSGSATNIYMSGADFTGCQGTIDESVTVSQSGTSYAPTLQITQNLSNDLLFSYSISSAATSGNAGTGWTTIGSASDTRSCGQYRIPANPGTYSALLSGNGTLSQAHNFIVIAFRAAGSTSTVPTFVRGTLYTAGTGTSASLALTTTSGNTAVIAIMNSNTAAAANYPTSVADSMGNTYSMISGTNLYSSASFGYTANGGSVSLWSKSGLTGGTGTLTVTWPNNVNGVSSISVLEYLGSLTTSGGNTTSGTGASLTLGLTESAGNLVLAAMKGATINANPYAEMNITQRNASNGSQSFGESMMASSGTFNVTGTFGASGAYIASGVVLTPPPAGPTDKTTSGDAYVSPWFGTKNVLSDAYITNPLMLTTALSYVKLAGNVQFKIQIPQGFVQFNSTIVGPNRVYVKLAGTIKLKNVFSFVNLAGRIQTTPSRSYVRLIGTIQNPNTKSVFGDCVVSTGLSRNFVRLAATLIQKIVPVPSSPGGSGGVGALGYAFYPTDSYVKLSARIHNPGSGMLLLSGSKGSVQPLAGTPGDSIQMPGQGYTTIDDWYSSDDAAGTYKPSSVFTIFAPSLPTNGISLVVTAFTAGVCSYQTRTRTWLRRVDAAPSGIVVVNQTNTHTLPNGAIITTTTQTTQNQDSTTTLTTINNSATPLRTSTILTEKSNNGQTSKTETDTTTINGVIYTTSKKTVNSQPPVSENIQPLIVKTLDGVFHYQWFNNNNNPEWAGGEQEGVTQTNTQTTIGPGTLNGQTTDAFGNPILQKNSTSTVTTPDGKVINTTISEVGTSKDYGTTTVKESESFVGLQKTTQTTTTSPDGSQTVTIKVENLLTGDITETDTETATDEYGQVTITTTNTETKTFPDPVTGAMRQQVNKTTTVNKGGVVTTDTVTTTTNDFEDSIIDQKIKVYFLQEFTITCVIDELSMIALQEINITYQKNFALLELFGQQLGNSSLSYPLRQSLITQFNNANAAITPFRLRALANDYYVVFAQSASAFRAKYIPGAEPHVYELQMILQSRSDVVDGTFGF